MRWRPILRAALRPTMRRVALGLLVPLVALLLGCALLLGRLAQGPLDVTGISHRWGGHLAHQGGGVFSWGHVALSWQPQHHAHPAELLVGVDDLRFNAASPPAGNGVKTPVAGEAGAAEPVQHLGHIGVVFNLAALLRGKVMLRSLDVQALALNFIHDGDGGYQLAGLALPSSHGKGGGFSIPLPGLAVQLRHISLRDVRLNVQDSRSPGDGLGDGLAVQLPLLVADYHKLTGWRGQLVASLQGRGLAGDGGGHDGPVDGRAQNAPIAGSSENSALEVGADQGLAGEGASTVRLTGSIAPAGEGKSHWQLALSPLRPAMLARWLPLKPGQKEIMAGVDLPLSLQLGGDLRGRKLAGRLEDLSGIVEVGAGQVTRPGRAALHLAGAHASLTLEPPPLAAPAAADAGKPGAAKGLGEAGKAAGRTSALSSALSFGWPVGDLPERLSGALSRMVPGHGGQVELEEKGQALTMQARLLLVDSHGAVVPLSLNSHGRLDDFYHPKQVELNLEGDAPGFDFATLASIWPEGAARGARRWMTANMTAGRGEGLHIETHLRSESGFTGLDVDQLSGELKGHDLSVTWLAGLPQVTGVEAYARFLDADHLQIDVSHGRLADGRKGSIALPNGRIILAGLLQKKQLGQFALGMEGELPSFLSILAQPKLNLLSRHPVGFSHAGGGLKGTFSLSLPLDVRVKMQEMSFGGEFEARQVQLSLPSLGLLRQGWGHLSLHDTGLDITGGAQLWGLGVRGTFFNSFQLNKPGRLMMRADLKAPLAAEDLRRLGAPASMARAPLLRGQGQAHLIYSQYGQGAGHTRATALLQTDFTAMAFNASYWQKPAGVPAGLRADLGWDDGRLTHLDDVQAYGPLLALKAAARQRHGVVGGLDLSHLRLGRTEGRATLDWPLKEDGPAGHYQFALQASTLDMSPWWGGTASSQNKGRAAAPDEPERTPLSAPVPVTGRPGHEGEGEGQQAGSSSKDSSSGDGSSAGRKPLLPAGRWAVSLHADQVFYGDGQSAGNVSASARWAAQRLEEASLGIEKPNRVTFSLAPVAGQAGAADVKLDIADAGALFASLGLYKQFSGGVLSLRGRCQPARPEKSDVTRQGMGFGLGLSPFQGALRVDHMALEHPPAPLVMATVMSPLHWGQLGRERFENVRLRASLHLAGGRLDVKDGRASNDIFGGTLQGWMDFHKAVLRMQGTLSPFFGVNHAAGTMFGEKTVMAPEKGSGVMAMTYTLEGSFAKPDLRVNPFSAFLPGALRNLFD